MEKAMQQESEFRSWEQKAGKLLNEKGIRQDIPDFIVGDVNKIKELENTTLRQIAQPYTFPLSYDEVRDLCRLQWKFKNDSKYFAMSMPLVGIPKRGIIYYSPNKIKRIEPKDKYPVYVLLNPTYEPFKDPDDDLDTIVDYEKCASIKKVCALVPRFYNIKVTGYNPYGELKEYKLFGTVSRYVQHEIDHLDGLLYTDQAHRIITLKELRWRRSIGKVQYMLDL